MVIATGILGPPPPGMFFLILGRASSSLQGLSIIPSVVDGDYTGEIKFLAQAPLGPITIQAGQRIAQALPLPILGGFSHMGLCPPASKQGSSDIYWIQQIKETRPVLKLLLDGKPFSGLLDSGSDATVISKQHWPQAWPLEPTVTQLTGIGQTQNTLQSSKILKWEDPEGNTGTVKPYVVEGLPLNLWGRDIMTQMGVIMMSPNDKVAQMMLKSGFLPGKGLGKKEDGITQAILPTPKSDRMGLGANLFS